jgi:hypothetical protein
MMGSLCCSFGLSLNFVAISLIRMRYAIYIYMFLMNVSAGHDPFRMIPNALAM